MSASGSSKPRYAIYYAPDAGSALWRFGCSVLGYDAASGREIAQWSLPGKTPNQWRDATAEPRRYGFHATLKAPFRLRDGASEAELVASLTTETALKEPVSLGLSRVTALGHFIALIPVAPGPELAALESCVVEAFEDFRAPLGPAERARRLVRPLSPRQTLYLDRYGYPFVKEEFRFHMTLTGPLPEGELAATRTALTAAYAEQVADHSITVDRLALFKQESDDARFRIIASTNIQQPLAAASR